MSAVAEITWGTSHDVAAPPSVVVAEVPDVRSDDEVIADAARARADLDLARAALDRAESDLASLVAAVESGDVAQASEAADAIPAAESKVRAARIVVERFNAAHDRAADAANVVAQRAQREREQVRLADLRSKLDAKGEEMREAILAFDARCREWRGIADEVTVLQGGAPGNVHDVTIRVIAACSPTTRKALGTRF